MNIIEVWKTFWKEAKQPSDETETIWEYCAGQSGHYLIGSVLAVLGLFIPFIWLIVPVAYFLIKELPDIKRCGSLVDALADTFFVFLGVLSPIFYPWNAIAAFLMVACFAYAKFKRSAI